MATATSVEAEITESSVASSPELMRESEFTVFPACFTYLPRTIFAMTATATICHGSSALSYPLLQFGCNGCVDILHIHRGLKPCNDLTFTIHKKLGKVPFDIGLVAENFVVHVGKLA